MGNVMNKIFDKFKKPTNKWVLCSERLPDKDDDYLVTKVVSNISYVHILGFGNGRFYEDGAIAWMPLPKPYRGTDNETD